tara:strand:- start:61802 stop:62557 length:756 start_codon:yes stop_codon:yes gene_type:complete
MSTSKQINKKILILSDNAYLSSSFLSICEELKLDLNEFHFARSPKSNFEIENNPIYKKHKIVNVKDGWKQIVKDYRLVISLHCKQIFPPELIKNVRCINVHPGYNPYNRGWFPQVFSIINKKPLGVTIHEIDEKLDHGKIIVRKKIDIKKSDTSGSLYKRILNLELDLIRKNLTNILEGNYATRDPESDGNINLKKDFNDLLEIDLSKTQTIKETIDLLRALTHEGYKNAYFIDEETGKKIYISLNLFDEN